MRRFAENMEHAFSGNWESGFEREQVGMWSPAIEVSRTRRSTGGAGRPAWFGQRRCEGGDLGQPSGDSGRASPGTRRTGKRIPAVGAEVRKLLSIGSASRRCADRTGPRRDSRTVYWKSLFPYRPPHSVDEQSPLKGRPRRSVRSQARRVQVSLKYPRQGNCR